MDSREFRQHVPDLHVGEINLDQEFIDMSPPVVQHGLQTPHYIEGVGRSGALVVSVVCWHLLHLLGVLGLLKKDGLR